MCDLNEVFPVLLMPTALATKQNRSLSVQEAGEGKRLGTLALMPDAGSRRSAHLLQSVLQFCGVIISQDQSIGHQRNHFLPPFSPCSLLPPTIREEEEKNGLWRALLLLLLNEGEVRQTGL